MLLRRPCCALLILAVWRGALSSCLGQLQPTRLSVLTPRSRAARVGPDAGRCGMALGVGPVADHGGSSAHTVGSRRFGVAPHVGWNLSCVWAEVISIVGRYR